MILLEKETVKMCWRIEIKQELISIGHKHDCWTELKEALRVQVHAGV